MKNQTPEDPWYVPAVVFAAIIGISLMVASFMPPTDPVVWQRPVVTYPPTITLAPMMTPTQTFRRKAFAVGTPGYVKVNRCPLSNTCYPTTVPGEEPHP